MSNDELAELREQLAEAEGARTANRCAIKNLQDKVRHQATEIARLKELGLRAVNQQINRACDAEQKARTAAHLYTALEHAVRVARDFLIDRVAETDIPGEELNPVLDCLSRSIQED